MTPALLQTLAVHLKTFDIGRDDDKNGLDKVRIMLNNV